MNSPASAAGDPLVSVWYRGVPSGTPRQDDLGAIRALGFAAVTWPADFLDGLGVLREMAARVGLQVVVRGRVPPLTALSALSPREVADVSFETTPPEMAPALVWRALAHGARLVAYDAEAGEGAGLYDDDGHPRTWVAPAAVIARHVSFNEPLLGSLKPGPPLRPVGALPAGVDVVLMDGGRSWVLVATNTSAVRAEPILDLAPGVPYALWTSLVGDLPVGMLDQPSGPRWTVGIEAGEAIVLAIDKTLR